MPTHRYDPSWLKCFAECACPSAQVWGNTRVRLESALGSLYEAQAGIRLAIAWGYFSQVAANEVLASMNCLGGRIYGLVRK